ncbi:MAG: hypothetical protein DMG57_07045 [Acidobacteria bacterium]|nr:MAG: hypothetical protein DMG57_07045 [Acidobacteriota bacterium]
MRNALGWLVLVATPCLAASVFRASVVKVDITPDGPQWLLGYDARQSNGVHDRISHRVVAMHDGQTEFVLVSSDLALISPAFYDEFTADLERETGIRRLQVWWTVTHTHAAPEVGPSGLGRVFLGDRFTHDYDHAYTGRVRKSLIDSIKEAQAKLAPATLEVGTGMSLANINRRSRDPQGHIFLGLNPYGPADRQIGLVRLKRSDGSLMALIVNYAIHGTVLAGSNLLISGDAPGIVAAYVEEKVGAPMLFINGAAGNIAPIYSGLPDFPESHIQEFNVILGDRILAANRDMAARAQAVRLVTGEQILETPRKQGLGWDDSLRNYIRTMQDGSALVRLPVRFLKISDEVVLWSLPVELFCEVAMHVRNRSPFAYTFYFGYANGWLGYLPTREAFSEGGYEVETSPFSAQAEDDLTGAVVTYLQSLIH